MLTGDSWAETVSRPGVFTARDGFWVATYYVSFVLLTQLVLINVVVAVLITGFDDYEEDEGLTLAEKLTALLESEQVELPDQESVESIGRNCAVIAVSARDKHNLALTADGSISGAGAKEVMASSATATSRSSCCPRRSRPLLGGASSLCRLEISTASPSPPTAPSSFFTWGEGEHGLLGQGRTCQTSCCPRRSRRGRRGGEQARREWRVRAGEESRRSSIPVCTSWSAHV